MAQTPWQCDGRGAFVLGNLQEYEVYGHSNGILHFILPMKFPIDLSETQCVRDGCFL